MGNIAVILILILVIGLAFSKIYVDKKNNVICSGCNLCSSKSECKGYKKTNHQGLL